MAASLLDGQRIETAPAKSEVVAMLKPTTPLFEQGESHESQHGRLNETYTTDFRRDACFFEK